MGFFQYDSGFMKIMDKVSRIVILNILFLFTCIPVLTVGIAMKAMYGTLMKWIGEKDDRVFHNYIKELRRNCIRTLAGTLIFAAAGYLLVLEFKAISMMSTPWNYVSGCIAGFTAVCISVTALYYFPVSARMEDSVWRLLAISFAGGMRCLVHTAALFILGFLEIFACTFSVKLVPIWVICGFAAFGWLRANIFLWVFEKIGIYKREGEVE